MILVNWMMNGFWWYDFLIWVVGFIFRVRGYLDYLIAIDFRVIGWIIRDCRGFIGVIFIWVIFRREVLVSIGRIFSIILWKIRLMGDLRLVLVGYFIRGFLWCIREFWCDWWKLIVN
jgi:hypothetical protein